MNALKTNMDEQGRARAGLPEFAQREAVKFGMSNLKRLRTEAETGVYAGLCVTRTLKKARLQAFVQGGNSGDHKSSKMLG